MAYNKNGSSNKTTAFEKVMDNRKMLVDEIISYMKEGKLIWECGWNRSALMPHNPISNVTYKGANRIALAVEAMRKGYDDPRWCTFKQLEDNGYKLKAGSKGVLCEKWIWEAKVKEEDALGNEVELIKKLSKPKVSYFYVFNASCVENFPPMDYSKGMDFSYATDEGLDKLIDDLYKSSECPIKEVAQHRAYYSPTEDEIVLPPRDAFESRESFIATMLHEMTHSTGHESRLHRNIANEFGSKEYAFEELVAELGSVLTQNEVGIELTSDMLINHASYTQSWLKALKDDYNDMFRAMAQSEKASALLYKNYELALGIDKEKEAGQKNKTLQSKKETVKETPKETKTKETGKRTRSKDDNLTK